MVRGYDLERGDDCGDEANAPIWFLTICKGCGLVWIADDVDGEDCPVGTPDAQGKYHVVFAFDLYDEDEERAIEEVVRRNLPNEWENFTVALRDPGVHWTWLVKDMPKHVTEGK